MWDMRVVTKLEVCVGDFVAACSYRNVGDGFVWACAGGPMVLISILTDIFCGRNWLVFLAGVICRGALVVISMSLVSLVKS